MVSGLRCGVGGVLGGGDQIRDRIGVDDTGTSRAQMGGVTAPHDCDDRGRAAGGDTVGGHRIAGPAQRGLRTVGDDHDGLVAARRSRGGVQCEFDDLLRRDHARPDSSRVLSTFTPRNSAEGHPWLTAATWPGWALPQLNAPPSRHVEGPPTASMEFQKSVVVAW